MTKIIVPILSSKCYSIQTNKKKLNQVMVVNDSVKIVHVISYDQK